jgi:hypothetical protein
MRQLLSRAQDLQDAQVVVNLHRGGLSLEEAVLHVALLRRKRDGGAGA